MKRSEHRILTTHAGSIQRPPELLKMIVAQQEGRSVDAAVWSAAVKDAVAEMVKRQTDAGLTVINDGEMSRASYAAYIKDHLSGLDGPENPVALHGNPAGGDDFPGYSAMRAGYQKYHVSRPSCNAPIKPMESSAVHDDIENLKAASKGANFEELFMTAISPASVANNHPNQYYATHEEYLNAIATALNAEYKAIIDAGLLLQIDCVDLGGRRPPGTPVEDVRKDRAMKVELINYATHDLPPDRMRVHVCWGALEGPHHTDAPLKDFVDILLTLRPAGLMVTTANGRHEHEWKVWKDVKVPDGKVIIPGVIDNTTNIIEHPEVVADRIVRFANIVGRENVIAGVDCGFSSNINIDDVNPKIAWAKLRSLAEGAELASKQLWRD
jgi:5-methyltetrahydropteroyltriglutamate--homocysteine methyltransferase